MVTFSHVPYADALEKGDRQEYIMQKVMKLPNIEENWNSEEVEELILSGLKA
jgi:kynurenine 3-monooxygenase